MFSLACGMQAPAIRSESAVSVYERTSANAETSTQVKMTVTADTLNVRNDANGQVVFYLIQNDTVTVFDELTIGDINWCRITPVTHAPRWVACDWLKGAE